MKLTTTNVGMVFRTCLGAKNKEHKMVEGVKLTVCFNPAEISRHRGDILSMLSQLPDEFKSGKGGGWSFLNLCVDRTGRQWTDSHVTCDRFVCLGLAIGALSYTIEDRTMWRCFPGGMPYITINAD